MRFDDPDFRIPLTDGEVAIFYGNIADGFEYVEQLSALLTEDERSRAGRFKFRDDRKKFILARTILKKLLGSLLRKDASSIKLEEGKRGKPFMEADGLEFNLSHSGEMVIYGFSRAGPIGVDVEWESRKVEVDSIAKRFFSEGEYKVLIGLEEPEQKKAFFEIWTRKEAFIKAIGEGLSFPLDSFDVSIGSDARLLSTHWDPAEAGEWTLRALDLPENYVGAVAVNGKIEHLRIREIDVSS